MKILIALTFLWPLAAVADFSSMGEVAFEYRQFKDDGNSATQDVGIAAFTRLETSYEGDAYDHRIRAFARLDDKESSRNLLWVEDAYAAYFLDEAKLWRVLAGYKIFNWTALEAFRPADTVNSRNYDAPLERPEKRGELALELEMPLYQGALTFSLFPRVENPHYPGANSRLGLGFMPAEPVWVDGSETDRDQWRLQFAVRATQMIADADVSLHVLRHYDRNFPVLGTSDYSFAFGTYVPNQGIASMNVPHYFQVTQIGGTLQYPFWDGWIVKAEAAHRDFEEDLKVLTFNGLQTPKDHSEVALGFEYGTSHDSGAETTFFLEAQRMFGTVKEERSALSIFQSDVFFGIRHARNDVMGTEFVLSAIVDTERSHEKLYNLQAARRLSDVWKASAQVRIFDAPPKNPARPTGLEVLNKNHHASFVLTRYF